MSSEESKTIVNLKTRIVELEALLKMAEERDEIHRKAAHDLRGPPNTIMNSVFLIRNGKNTEEMLNTIQEGASQIGKLVEELRSQTRKLRIEKKEINLKSVIELSTVSAPRNNTDIQLSLQDITCYCDEYHIRRVLENLIRNAIDAMPNGGKLTIQTTQEKDEIMISVADTGIGIKKDVLSSLFQLGFSTKREKGTGLGLHYCKQIIEAHGGNITATNNTDRQGATFTISLSSQPNNPS